MARNWRKLPWYARYRIGGKVASDARKLMVLATHQHCHIEFRGPVRLGPGFHLDIADNGTLIVGPGVDFRYGFVCEIAKNGRVEIGAGTAFTGMNIIQCSTSIKIGKRCGFGWGSNIVDGNHKFQDWTKNWADQGEEFRSIEIGDNSGSFPRCAIINNLGTNTIIGANSVVVDPIPSYCLAVGAPARVVKYYGPPDQKPPGLDV